MVEILSINKDEDGLHFGNVAAIEHWPQSKVDIETVELSNYLEKVFKNDDLLSDLYPEKLKHNNNWVVARWLELLPVHLNIKTTFVSKHSFHQAKDFVQSIILK